MATPPLVQLGSDQGTVYDHMDFSLDSPTYAESYETGKKYADSMLKPKASIGDKMKAIADNRPEYWVQHDGEMNKEFNGLLDYATKIFSAGENPTTGTSEASLDWRKKMMSFESKAKFSMDLKADEKTFQDMTLDPKKVKKYTDQSLRGRIEYHEQTLSERIATRKNPPLLLLKKDKEKFLEQVEQAAKALHETNPNASPAQLRKWGIALANDLVSPAIAEEQASLFKTFSQSEQASIQTLADSKGVDLETYLTMETAFAFFPERTYDHDTILTNVIPEVDVSITEHKRSSGGTRKVEEWYEKPESVRRATLKRFNQNPGYLDFYKDMHGLTTTDEAFVLSDKEIVDKMQLKHMQTLEGQLDDNIFSGGYKKETYNADIGELHKMLIGQEGVEAQKWAWNFLQGTALKDGSIIEKEHPESKVATGGNQANPFFVLEPNKKPDPNKLSVVAGTQYTESKEDEMGNKQSRDKTDYTVKNYVIGEAGEGEHQWTTSDTENALGQVVLRKYTNKTLGAYTSIQEEYKKQKKFDYNVNTGGK